MFLNNTFQNTEEVREKINQYYQTCLSESLYVMFIVLRNTDIDLYTFAHWSVFSIRDAKEFYPTYGTIL